MSRLLSDRGDPCGELLGGELSGGELLGGELLGLDDAGTPAERHAG